MYFTVWPVLTCPDLRRLPSSGLAHAFAQLSLRHCVTVDDVTMAILLYEESLAACFGYSPLDVSHTPHIREADLDANLGRQVRTC